MRCARLDQTTACKCMTRPWSLIPSCFAMFFFFSAPPPKKRRKMKDVQLKSTEKFRSFVPRCLQFSAGKKFHVFFKCTVSLLKWTISVLEWCQWDKEKGQIRGYRVKVTRTARLPSQAPHSLQRNRQFSRGINRDHSLTSSQSVAFCVNSSLIRLHCSNANKLWTVRYKISPLTGLFVKNLEISTT